MTLTPEISNVYNYDKYPGGNLNSNSNSISLNTNQPIKTFEKELTDINKIIESTNNTQTQKEYLK